jgi:hypothetical protein
MNPIMRPFIFLFLCVSLAAVAATSSSASVLVNETWSTYSDDSEPSGSWTVWSGGQDSRVGSVRVVPQSSPFGSGGKSVLITGTNPKGPGPMLQELFSPLKTAFILRFDFHIPSSPGSGVLPTMTLADTAGRSGLKLNLCNGFLTPNHALKIANQGAAWNQGDIISPFRYDTWYRIEIAAKPVAEVKWTYDIRVTPFAEEPVVVKGLNVVGDISSFSAISFSWNSTNPNGEFYIANVRLETAK